MQARAEQGWEVGWAGLGWAEPGWVGQAMVGSGWAAQAAQAELGWVGQERAERGLEDRVRVALARVAQVTADSG